MTMTAPGWYPDPTAPGTLRWWDGSQWSVHRSAMPQPYFVRETDGYAIASVIAGVVGVPIVPIVLGVMARNRIRESGGLKDGNGLAIAGIVLGIVQIVIWVVVILAIIGVAAGTSAA
jgi:hypothetical protein